MTSVALDVVVQLSPATSACGNRVCVPSMLALHPNLQTGSSLRSSCASQW